MCKYCLSARPAGLYISRVIRMMTGFSSLNDKAGSRDVSDMRFFLCP